MAENQSGFSGYTASAHCKPEYNFAHNLRITDSVYNQEHIGPGEHENWIGGDEIDPRLLFNKVFESATEKYNENQKRSDRKIKDYYQRVLDDGRFGKSKTLKIGNKTKTIDTSKKPIYEFIIQIGNREEHPDSQDSKKVMKSFIDEVWKEKFGKNFKLIRVDYHDDEYSQDKDGEYTIKSPAHIHVAFVPVVEKTPEELKGKGVFKLELQHSLSQACEQAGFKTDHLTEEERAIKNEIKANIRKAKEEGNKELKEQLQEQLVAYTTYTSQQRFEESVRFAFAEHCRANGIEIDLTPGKKHSHQNKKLYQINQEQKRLEETIEKKEQLEVIVDSKIEELKQDKADFEQQKQDDLADIKKQQEQLETDKSEFAEQKKSDLEEIKESRNSLQEDINNFAEDKKKAEKILERENQVAEKEEAIQSAKKEISTWEEDKKKTDDYIKQFDFDANKEILKDSDITSLSSPEIMEEKWPLKKTGTFAKENQFEYAHRVVKRLWDWTKDKVKNFQNKYNKLKDAVKNLYKENLQLKREKEEQHQKDLENARIDKQNALKTQQEQHNKEIQELKDVIHGTKSFKETKDGTLATWSYGLEDYAEALFSLDKKTIVNIYNEMKDKGMNTVKELYEADKDLDEPKKKFLHRHFERIRTIDNEIDLELERKRSRGYS